ncbi:EIF3J family protein [Megaselia abdita]
MEDDWENLDVEKVTAPVVPKKDENLNKWEGEDDDDNIKESWEDEDEEEEKKDEEKVAKQPQPPKLKPKKSLQAKLDEKERQKQEELDRLEEERLANMTPEERLAEKLRQQQLEKDADLKFALGTFGVTDIPSGLDAFDPTNKQEFSEFGASLAAKISLYKSSEEYPRFVEELVRSICVHLQAADLKKVKITVESLHTEKQKMEKEKTKKPVAKGKTKVKLRVDHDVSIFQSHGNFNLYT